VFKDFSKIIQFGKFFFSKDETLPKLLSKVKEQELLYQANVKVPDSERQAYMDLLAYHHDVFSTN
jgi:hypothetical protein